MASRKEKNASIPPTYQPQGVEDGIYQQWEQSGFFTPEKLPRRGKPFTIAMPPPNATGVLHAGHAVMLAIQDIVARFQRMRGRRVLWLPGTDHAAIATQAVVEKLIAKEGKTRQQLGREVFLERVKKFVADSQGTIRRQTRKMGSSCDWSRERYTLDAGLSAAVSEAFVRMYRDGLIYRGYRIVNWCPRCHSTLSDDEVEYKEQKTKFYYFKYGPVVIGTARPETKFQDKTIIVHPDDKRYQHLHGKEMEIEWIEGKVKANIIADKVADKDFGTGAMTITPAHSFADFELAQKYKLPVLPIVDEDGKLTQAAGTFAGKDARKSREEIVVKLQAKGLVDHIDENYVHNLSVCYRCGTPVEPLPSKQWFVNMSCKLSPFGRSLGGGKVESSQLRYPGREASLKELAAWVVKSSQIEIIPDRFTKTYFHWMDNLRDWCISRQIWFGHRIPVWYWHVKTSPHPTLSPEGRGEGGERAKVWDLKIYGRDVFDAIKNNTKTIETRAGRKPGTGKDWSQFKPGDTIVFSLADEQTDAVVPDIEPVQRTIVAVKHFATLQNVFTTIYRPQKDYPGKSFAQLEAWWKKRPALYERLQKYGVWVFELVPTQTNSQFAIRNSQSENEEMYVGVEPPVGDGWVQDPDTLDTWFSSGLWTFSILGWPSYVRLGRTSEGKPSFAGLRNGKPAKIGDLKTYHPTNLMETGYDILFFWVARMILMSTYLVGEVPFRQVYLHGMIRDREGRKMSKSRPETAIDPVDMIQKYGADAMRLSLVIGTTAGNDTQLWEEKIASYRNFVNKLWNIARFISMTVGELEPVKTAPTPKTLADKWILAELDAVIKRATVGLEEYEFSAVGEAVYEFTWSKLADWYLEIAKVEGGKEKMLSYILQQVLALWHPFTPFVTEYLWERFGTDKLLMIQPWPKSGRTKAVKDFAIIQSVVTAIRNLRSTAKVDPAKRVIVQIAAGKHAKLFKSQTAVITALGRCSELTIEANLSKPTQAASAIVSGATVYLLLAGLLDVAKERERITRELQEAESYLKQLAAKLSNKNFVDRAPVAVVSAEREKLSAQQHKVGKLKEQLAALG